MTEDRVATAVMEMIDNAPRETRKLARKDFIDAVRRFQRWNMTDKEVWRRIRQASRPSPNPKGNRNFAGAWALIGLRVVVKHGGVDLISDLIAEARIEGKRERELCKVHKVQPQERVVRGKA